MTQSNYCTPISRSFFGDLDREWGKNCQDHTGENPSPTVSLQYHLHCSLEQIREILIFRTLYHRLLGVCCDLSDRCLHRTLWQIVLVQLYPAASSHDVSQVNVLVGEQGYADQWLAEVHCFHRAAQPAVRYHCYHVLVLWTDNIHTIFNLYSLNFYLRAFDKIIHCQFICHILLV